MRLRGSRRTASSCSCSRRPSRRAWPSPCPQIRCVCTTHRSLRCRTCSHGLTTPPKSLASRRWLRLASEPAPPPSGTQAQLRAIWRTKTLATLSDCAQEGNVASLVWLPSASSTHLWALFCLRWKRAGERGRDISPEACVILPHSNSESSPFSSISCYSDFNMGQRDPREVGLGRASGIPSRLSVEIWKRKRR